ncbi:MAG: signal peptidase II [Nannocystaceae bacterium]
MNDAPRERPRAGRIAAALAVTSVVLAVDLWTKAWAWEHLRRAKPIAVIDRVLYLEFSFNTGSAFGFMNQSALARPFFLGVTVLTVVVLGLLLRWLPSARIHGFLAIGLVLGGALGNTHDRIWRTLEEGGKVRHGVVDWILVHYLPNTPWPNFNVADVALVIGFAVLVPLVVVHLGLAPER